MSALPEMRPRRLLVLEPYFGGSHRAVLEALLPRLRWEADLLTLPARKWKWRMRGAAITMAAEARRLHAQGAAWDLIYASSFVNLAEFVGMAGDAVADVGSIVYFHENQLLYPNRHSAEWDYQFPLTNITSALAADACLFNTAWNRDGFLREIPGFLAAFPDHQPKGVAEVIAARSAVLSPPFDPGPFDAAGIERGPVCRIVWPHRWEHDKDPGTFFNAVSALAAEGLDFEVAVAGQAYRETTGEFELAAAQLGRRLVHLGEPDSRGAYARLLSSCDVAVSTALNEFFGLAMVESCYAGCMPLVPDRLAYPEIYPAAMRYDGPAELQARLREFVVNRPAPNSMRGPVERFTVEQLSEAYEAAFESVRTTRRLG
jgi:glycosyltransferase involved in cell wall biosynthesis